MGIIILVVAALREIQSAMMKITPKSTKTHSVLETPKSKKKNPLHETTKRMCRIAGFVGACQIVSMTCTIWTSSLLQTWTISTSLWLKCSFETNALREWDAVKRNPCSTSLHHAFVRLHLTRLSVLQFLHLFSLPFFQNLVWISGRRRNLRRRQSCVEKNSKGLFESLHL